jgi:hypothetical protein
MKNISQNSVHKYHLFLFIGYKFYDKTKMLYIHSNMKDFWMDYEHRI